VLVTRAAFWFPKLNNRINPNKSALEIFVAFQTCWDCERSPTGQRRFFLADIRRIIPRVLSLLDDRLTINYARVSSQDQKGDLIRQVQVLEAFSSANGWQFETIQDL
jgi:hypothetical protein